MSYSISTLLTRNLHDVFGENDPARRRAAIDEIFTEDCVFYDPMGCVYLETFVVSSWAVHLRQHDRPTRADRHLEDQLRKCTESESGNLRQAEGARITFRPDEVLFCESNTRLTGSSPLPCTPFFASGSPPARKRLTGAINMYIHIIWLRAHHRQKDRYQCCRVLARTFVERRGPSREFMIVSFGKRGLSRRSTVCLWHWTSRVKHRREN